MNCVLSALALFVGAAAAGGCGGGKPPLNTAPLTDEEKAAIKAQDQEVDEAERSGSGTATKGKKGRRPGPPGRALASVGA